MKKHWRLTKRHPENNNERTKLERSSAMALHVLEIEHHVEFEHTEILSKYWPIYRDRINAEQWFISHQPEACNLKAFLHLQEHVRVVQKMKRHCGKFTRRENRVQSTYFQM